MKHIAPFLGIRTPERRTFSRKVLDGTPRHDEADCSAIALRCWALEEREYHHFAVDCLRRYAGRLSSGFLPVARQLITTVPWWDTVDLLAVHVVGPLATADPGPRSVMDGAKTDPAAVRDFVAAHRDVLSPLSAREALKNL